MNLKKISAHCLVRILVEVRTSDTWGAECTIEQIHRQAVEAATNRLKRNIDSSTGIKLVGEPEVLTVTMQER